MVEKRWRMATNKGKGLRTFPRARLILRPSPEPSAKFLSRNISRRCPMPTLIQQRDGHRERMQREPQRCIS